MMRWTLAVGAILVLGAIVTVSVARALGWSGSRLSILGSVIALWLAAYVLWGLAGGLAAHYGVIARYDGGFFAALAVGGAAWQYRAQVRRMAEPAVSPCSWPASSYGCSS